MTRNASDIVIRIVLNGNDPIRLEPTSAKSAVAVHERATPNEINSPTNILLLLEISRKNMTKFDMFDAFRFFNKKLMTGDR